MSIASIAHVGLFASAVLERLEAAADALASLAMRDEDVNTLFGNDKYDVFVYDGRFEEGTEEVIRTRKHVVFFDIPRVDLDLVRRGNSTSTLDEVKFSLALYAQIKSDKPSRVKATAYDLLIYVAKKLVEQPLVVNGYELSIVTFGSIEPISQYGLSVARLGDIEFERYYVAS